LLLAIVLAACSGGADAEGSEAQAQTDAGDIVACDLITKADAEAIVGTALAEPVARALTGMDGERATSCILTGESTLMLRVWQPYRGSETTSAAIVQRVRSERAEQAAAESDAELRKLTASTAITAFDGLSAPAALEDMRGGLGGVTLHIVDPDADVYLAVDAETPELARAVAERVLAKLPR
jgi:hypothetical protein